jgi:hypothetical protein
MGALDDRMSCVNPEIRSAIFLNAAPSFLSGSFEIFERKVQWAFSPISIPEL